VPRVRLYPNAIVTDNANWTLTGAATKNEAIDDLWGNHDITSYIQSDDDAQRIVFGFDNMPSSVVVNFVELHIVAARIESGRTFANAYIGIQNASGTDGTQASFSFTTDVYTHHFSTHGEDPSGSAWTETLVNNLRGWITPSLNSGAPDFVRLTSMYLDVDYVATPVKIGTVRDVLSRYLLTFRRPTSVVEVLAPLRYADVEIGDTIRLSHFAGENTATEGWGYDVWDGRLCAVLGTSIDLDNMNVRLRLLDLRDCLLSFWDTGISEEAPSAFGQGVARLDPGATRTFTRASNAWIENAAVAAQNSIQIAQIGEDIEKQAADGLLIEAAGTNEQIQSSFANAETGWTSAGEGSNGSAIAVDTSDLLFEDTVSGNSIKFTAGSPIHVADLTFIGTATSSITANSIVRASFDHKDDSGSPLYYAIQRGSSDYYRDSDQTWQGALTWNAMTAATTPHRHISKQIDIGTNNRTLQATLGIPTATGVAGQINHLYHVQIELGDYATSRILTSTATVTRSTDSLVVSNDHPIRTWPVEQGTFFFQFIPEWSEADLAAEVKELFRAYYDDNNIDRIEYSAASNVLVFIRRVAGVDYTSSVAYTAVRGTAVSVAARWCGAEGEHDLTAYTISVFADGVKGTDATAVPFASLPAGASLYVGQDQLGTSNADGWFKHMKITPLVLTDDEIADLP
jgi:hypothetical protein